MIKYAVLFPFLIEMILMKMEATALMLGITKGVAAISIDSENGALGPIYTRAVKGHIQRGKRSEDDPATNYLGVALEKIAVMKATSMNSGVFQKVKNGETKYRGGLVQVVGCYTVYVAFSGGTEDQDVEVAKIAMKSLCS